MSTAKLDTLVQRVLESGETAYQFATIMSFINAAKNTNKSIRKQGSYMSFEYKGVTFFFADYGLGVRDE